MPNRNDPNYDPTLYGDPNVAPVDPTTGAYEQRPGQVYMPPNNKWGLPVGWMSGEDYNAAVPTGFLANWPKLALAAALPFGLGAAGALGAFGGAAGAAEGAGEAGADAAGAGAAGAASGGAAGIGAGGAAAGAAGAAAHGGLLASLTSPTGLLTLGDIASKIVGGALSSPQKRQSFAGTAMDPVQNGTDFLGALKSEMAKLNAPQTPYSPHPIPMPGPLNVPGLNIQLGGAFHNPVASAPSTDSTSTAPGGPQVYLRRPNANQGGS